MNKTENNLNVNVVRQEVQEKLWRCVESGNYKGIRQAIMSGADVDAKDEQGRTAFQIATQRADTEAAWIILAARDLKFKVALGLDLEDIPGEHEVRDDRASNLKQS
jgi:hypothetical protein